MRQSTPEKGYFPFVYKSCLNGDHNFRKKTTCSSFNQLYIASTIIKMRSQCNFLFFFRSLQIRFSILQLGSCFPRQSARGFCQCRSFCWFVLLIHDVRCRLCFDHWVTVLTLRRTHLYFTFCLELK